MKRSKTVICILFVCAVIGLGGLYFGNRLTYLEYTQGNAAGSGEISVDDNDTALKQEFLMPYDLFSGINIKMSTSGDVNSDWSVSVVEKATGREVYRWRANANQAGEETGWQFDTKRPVSVKKNGLYCIMIQGENSYRGAGLDFTVSEDKDLYPDGKMYINGKEYNGDLCFSVYGGARDLFWVGIYLFIVLYVLAFCGMAWKNYRKGRPVFSGNVIGALLLGGLCFIMMLPYANEAAGKFLDESDGIIGGILIAKRGEVLYRDYYTQHTPFIYYLSAGFSLLGAKSVQQFRILFYILQAAIWALLFIRHSGFYGKKKIYFLAALEILVNVTLYPKWGGMLLGDNVQGFCMVVLLLEFFRALQDNDNGWKRCSIVSAAIWCGIGSAFLSVYAIFAVGVGWLIHEAAFWRKASVKTFKAVADRYYRWVICLAVPGIAALLYFKWNGALNNAYLMAFKFNTDIYPYYNEVKVGGNVVEPFFFGISFFFNSFKNYLTGAITGSVDSIWRVLLMGFLFWNTFNEVFRKKNLYFISVFLCACWSMTRGNENFHGMPFWNVAVAAVVLFASETAFRRAGRQSVLAAFSLVALLLTAPYVTKSIDNILLSQKSVTALDQQIVSITGEGEKIFLDGYQMIDEENSSDIVYLLYKNRIPANRNLYILPWYMDWFERDTVEDLASGKPKYAVYNPSLWENDYSNVLDQYLEDNYIRFAEDSPIWVLK